MKTPQAEEIPLPPHKPRTDAQSFSLADTEQYNYVHQHTRGHGPMQDCSIIEQYTDGYCLVIAGHDRNVVAWSGCLTRERELNHNEKKTLAEAKAKR